MARLPSRPGRVRSGSQPGHIGRFATIISAHLAGKIIISVVTVTAPDLHAAAAVARAVVSDVLKRQALSSSQPADCRAQYRAEAAV